MKKFTQSLAVLCAVFTLACGVKFPPIVITLPPPTNTSPVEPEPVVTPEPEPPPPIVTPEPTPEPEPAPLVNLNLVVQDVGAVGIPGAECGVDGDVRRADGSGFINYAVRGPVDVTCTAFGFVTRSERVKPFSFGNFPFVLHRVPAPPAPAPLPVPDACATPGKACVDFVARSHAKLLEENTFRSCTDFITEVLKALGPDWGYVGKTAGESQHVPRNFKPGLRKGTDGNQYFITGVSHDAIKHKDGRVFDLLGNATANEPCPEDVRKRGECWQPGPAVTQWGAISSEHVRVNNPFVPVR